MVRGIHGRVDGFGRRHDSSTARSRFEESIPHGLFAFFHYAIRQQLTAVNVADQAHAISILLYHLTDIHPRQRLDRIQAVNPRGDNLVEDWPEIAIGMLDDFAPSRGSRPPCDLGGGK